MLVFPLKKKWYEKIRSGEKRIEYREIKDYWRSRLYNELGFFPEQGSGVIVARKCVLRLGYTKRRMTADIVKIEVVDGADTDLHVDKMVYAIHLANVKEVEN